MNRQDIIKAIVDFQEYIADGEYNGNLPPIYLNTANLAIVALEQQLNNGWIPASKPPKDSGEYFATVKWNFGILDTEKVVYAKDINQWIWDFDGSDNFVDVTAWMPMPEPYKEGE